MRVVQKKVPTIGQVNYSASKLINVDAHLQQSMIRCNGLLLRVALRHLVCSNDVLLELVEHDLCQEDVVGHMMRSLQTAAVHVVGEDRLEAGPMSVEEVLVSLGVVEHAALLLAAEQRVWMTRKHLAPELVMLSAHVHPYAVVLFPANVLQASK